MKSRKVMYAPEPTPAGWDVRGDGPAVISHAPQVGGYQAPGQAWPQPTNCPRGLEYLTHVDQLLIHQKIELLEAFTGFETANKYTIKNTLGQKVYYAAEKSDCCTRNICGPIRPFDMKIYDLNKQEVLIFNRPLRCDSCLCFCCLQKMDVYASPGDFLGSIEQTWSIIHPRYVIKDAAGNPVLKMAGPCCTWSLCGDVEFEIFSESTGESVGKISKQWSGLAKEMFTDADNFGISFPLDLDVRMKAVLLGAVFLIDFMFFEQQNNKENDGIGMFS
ncbi:unnamed protein product [Notodromas monacha]|uniref:Phospholipid scramblase n=1 Tax=Notodromas monacha TaxID=399045 RepID=A0A7R9BPG1_9CRUS|nr:unnamed protein product [Notodromas monacha]CAG0917882.1 unnamed protein product [Notodromas monacha]